jgi:hypothetical protein
MFWTAFCKMDKYIIFFVMVVAASMRVAGEGFGPAMREGRDARVDTSRRLTLYDTLSFELGRINYEDQRYRLQLDDTTRRYGSNSAPVNRLLSKMAAQDSVNLKKVEAMLDKYGWLGPDQVGDDESGAQFFVIQHAGLDVQLRYLPVIVEAAKEGKAQLRWVALLEDRIAIRQGRKQRYGTQLSYPGYQVLPLENRDSVDVWRAAMGLSTLAEYLRSCCNVDSVVIQKKK